MNEDNNLKEIVDKLVDMKIDLEGYIAEIENLISECDKILKK